MSAIVLIGFMGAGKSTISQLLAEKIQQPTIDLDQVLETKLGMTIPAFFDTYGEAAFRKRETEILAQALQSDQIIATGGGIVTSQPNRQLLEKEQVVYLKAAPEQLITRIRSDRQTIRPLAENKTDQELLALFLAREAWYEDLATLVVETDKWSLSEIVQMIQKEVMS